MFKYIISFFFIFNFLNASLIKNIEYLELKGNNIEIEKVKNNKNFKKTTLPFYKETTNTIFIKISFDKRKLDSNIKIIELINIIGNIEVEKKINLIEENENIKVFYLNNENFIENVYVKLNNEDEQISFNIKVSRIKDFIYNQPLNSSFYSFAYGIIFAAFLYYFALYLFNRDNSYIYYSLTQLSILLILFINTNDLIKDESIWEILLFLSFFIFSNLFTKSFLNTKILSPKSHLFLNIIIVVYLLEALIKLTFNCDFFSQYLPLTSLLIVYIIAAINVYLKGYKPAIYYLFGWGIVITSLFLIEFDSFVDAETILHISIPLESLILAFSLSYKMKLLQKEKLEQQEFLAHQSKLASMGEMIGNIAHQWRQPLTHLSYIIMNLKAAYKKDKLTKDFFDERSKEADAQLEFMSQTINDFIDFFKLKKEKELFNLNEAINEVINLLQASFKAHNIKVRFQSNENIEIKSLKGELLQVLFNILNNSKDEFIRKEQKNAFIEIKLFRKSNKTFIEISDNAGGMQEELLKKVFEPYFTTKDKGLGIGLYMSKMIVEKNLDGELDVKNYKNGLSFNIKINS